MQARCFAGLLPLVLAGTLQAASGTISAEVSPSACVGLGSNVTVTLRISGYTSTTEIDGFNFKVLYNSNLFSLVAGSIDLGTSSGLDPQWLAKANQESMDAGYVLFDSSDGSLAGVVAVSAVDLGYSDSEHGTAAESGFLVSFTLQAIAGGTGSIMPTAYPDGSVLFDTDLVPTGVPAFSRVSITVDTNPPSITCPTNQTLACAGTNGAQAFFTASATDTCDPGPMVSCTPSSGSFFAPGTNRVQCVAIDAAGNSNQCSFTVTVVDPTAAVLSIKRQGGDALICWPLTCTPYMLEETAALKPPISWSPVAAPVAVRGGRYCVTVPLGNANQFFRLKSP